LYGNLFAAKRLKEGSQTFHVWLLSNCAFSAKNTKFPRGISAMSLDRYIEQHDNGYRVSGTRVSLDSLVYRFREGLSPESIQADCFPTLTLEQVYGALIFYLRNKAEIDEYLKQSETEEETFKENLRTKYPNAYRRLDEIIANTQLTRQRKFVFRQIMI
jgi:uncharacterized protein (DUF433 family)